jgi:hypothetical protein
MSAKLITTNDPDRIVKRVSGIPVRVRHYAEADRLLAGTPARKAVELRDALAAITAAEPGWSDPAPVAPSVEDLAA